MTPFIITDDQRASIDALRLHLLDSAYPFDHHLAGTLKWVETLASASACQGANCGATDGKSHSRECIEEAAAAQGWTPTEADFADCPKASAPEPVALPAPDGYLNKVSPEGSDYDAPYWEESTVRAALAASQPAPVEESTEHAATMLRHRLDYIASGSGYRAALSAQRAPVEARCQYCDGTGDVHSIDGEWRGQCNQCNSAALSTPVQAQAVRESAHSDKNAAFADWMLHGIEISGEAADGFKLNAAVRDVLVERQRQISIEGWTPEHDDEHGNGEMALAAGSYASAAAGWTSAGRWPWSLEWWKPGTPRRMLVKAGALILAEIERLDRAAAPTPSKGEA